MYTIVRNAIAERGSSKSFGQPRCFWLLGVSSLHGASSGTLLARASEPRSNLGGTNGWGAPSSELLKCRSVTTLMILSSCAMVRSITYSVRCRPFACEICATFLRQHTPADQVTCLNTVTPQQWCQMDQLQAQYDGQELPRTCVPCSSSWLHTCVPCSSSWLFGLSRWPQPVQT